MLNNFFTVYANEAEMLDICESSGTLQVIYIVMTAFKILKYLIPLILIVRLTIDIYPLIINVDDRKKIIDVAKKRLIAAIIIFFVPTIFTYY